MSSNEFGHGTGRARPRLRRSWLHGVWRNPLARSADRWQAGLRVVLITLWLLALPVAATVSSMLVADGLKSIDQAADDHSLVPALLLADAPIVIVFAETAVQSTLVDVQARWIAPDGSDRSGQVRSPSGLAAGAQIEIWIDRSGTPITAPERPSGAVGSGVLIGGGIWLGWGILLAGLFRLSVLSLDRGRRAEWDREWLGLAPL